MRASLYHRGSFASMIVPKTPFSREPPASAAPALAGGSRLNGARRSKSQVVFKISLGAHAAADAEDVGRHDVRVQLDVVARPLPEVAGVAEQLVQLVRLVPVQAEL